MNYRITGRAGTESGKNSWYKRVAIMPERDDDYLIMVEFGNEQSNNRYIRFQSTECVTTYGEQQEVEQQNRLVMPMLDQRAENEDESQEEDFISASVHDDSEECFDILWHPLLD